MTILDTIIATKKLEVARRKEAVPLETLQQSPLYNRSPLSLAMSLQTGRSTGIIAEFKRRSPSKGLINGTATVANVVTAYEKYGAAAVSVLTDGEFFGGQSADLIEARSCVNIPLLRKDFIIDPYQIHEAKSIGADVILLIAACLQPEDVYMLAQEADDLGLSILLELHEESELDHICSYTNIIGINNRNLKTFEVDIEQSLRMASQLPTDTLKVAESGIDKIDMIQLFKQAGFDGFLIGEQFMKAPDPAKAFSEFTDALKQTYAS